MPSPNLPRVHDPAAITASAWNLVVDEIERANRLTVQAPLVLEEDATGRHLMIDWTQEEDTLEGDLIFTGEATFQGPVVLDDGATLTTDPGSSTLVNGSWCWGHRYDHESYEETLTEASYDDYVGGATSPWWKLTPTLNLIITGIEAPDGTCDGAEVVILNLPGYQNELTTDPDADPAPADLYSIFLSHQSADSVAENRILTPQLEDWEIPSGDSCTLRYDRPYSRWRVVEGYSPMIGASVSDDGFRGLVPTPPKEQKDYFLRGDATWSPPLVVRKNSAGSDFGPRRRLNLIEGTGVTLTVASDATNDEVDVTIEASGGAGTFHGARVYNNADISIPHNSLTAIAFNSERLDTDDYHDVTTDTSRFTIPEGLDGIYHIGGTVDWDAASSSYTQVGLVIRVNGSTAIANQARDGGTNLDLVHLNVATDWYLGEGDYVELCVIHQNASSAARSVNRIDASSPEFWLHYLGP